MIENIFVPLGLRWQLSCLIENPMSRFRLFSKRYIAGRRDPHPKGDVPLLDINAHA